MIMLSFLLLLIKQNYHLFRGLVRMIHQMEDLVDLAEFDECCCDALGDILTLFHSCDRRLER